jgi:hypothetical protein
MIACFVYNEQKNSQLRLFFRHLRVSENRRIISHFRGARRPKRAAGPPQCEASTTRRRRPQVRGGRTSGIWRPLGGWHPASHPTRSTTQANSPTSSPSLLSPPLSDLLIMSAAAAAPTNAVLANAVAPKGQDSARGGSLVAVGLIDAPMLTHLRTLSSVCPVQIWLPRRSI